VNILLEPLPWLKIHFYICSDDLHGGWESKTGIHGGLFRSSLDNTAANVDESVKLLISAGVDKSKLIVGLPSYGNAFNLADSNNNGVGAAVTSGAGNMDYRDICQKTRSGALTYRWDDTQKVPYAFSGSYWVGYDDVKSVTEKANYIKSNNLGGGMFWALDNDDFDNVCGDGKFPLITKVYSIVVGGQSPAVSFS
jgi:chitinase